MTEETWITLQTDHGTLTLATTDGLSFEAGDGTDDSSMTFQGPQDVINAALGWVGLHSEMGFAGQGTLSLIAGDVTASWHVGVHAPIDANAAREEILEGVTTIHSAVQPGRMVAYGPEAYDVAWYLGDVKEGPMMAIASWGKGRVLATPDHQTLNMHVYGEGVWNLLRERIGLGCGLKGEEHQDRHTLWGLSPRGLAGKATRTLSLPMMRNWPAISRCRRLPAAMDGNAGRSGSTRHHRRLRSWWRRTLHCRVR